MHDLRLNHLTCLGFEVNAALDADAKLPLSFDGVYTAIEDETLMEILAKHLEEVCDFSSLEGKNLYPVLRNAAGALQGRERRKTGVEHNSLCLIMAIVLEAAQQLKGP